MKNYFPLFIALFLLIGCEEAPTMREYVEVVILPDTPMAVPQQSAPNDDIHKNLNTDKNDMRMPDDPQMASMLNASVAQVDLDYKVPEGWQAQAGSGMRILTLFDGDNTIECSVISLGGSAGGVEQNILRWMGQVGLNLTSDQFTEFISTSLKTQIQSGQESLIVNFNALLSDDAAQSMAGSIIQGANKTLFIKMTGMKKDIDANFPRLLEFIKSIKL